MKKTQNNIQIIGLSLLMLVMSLWAGPVLNTSDGSSSYSFLKLSTSPRQVGFARGGAALSTTAAEAITNPLALSQLSSSTLSLSHISLPKEVGASMEALYFAIPKEKISLGFGGRFLKFDEIMGRDEFGVETGEYGAASFDLSLALAAGTSKSLDWSIQTHFAQSLIDDAISRAFFLDMGLAYDLKDFRIAALFYNLGWASDYDKEEVVLPLTLQAGIAYAWDINNRFQWIINGDVLRVNDEGMLGIISSELSYNELISLRLGYPVYTDNEDASLNAGMALKVIGWTIEYAYGGHRDLSGEHHINVEIAF